MNMRVRAIGATGVRIDLCNISYPHLFQARASRPDRAPRFSASFIMPPDFTQEEVALVTAAMTAAGTARYPDGAFPSDYKWPKWRNGSEYHEVFTNRWALEAGSPADNKPEVVDQAGRPVTDPAVIVPGSLVNVYLNFYAHQNGGVSAGLNAVQLVDNINITRLGARKGAKDVFGQVPGAPTPSAPVPSQPGPSVPGAGPSYAPPGAAVAPGAPPPAPSQGPGIPGIS